MSKHDLGYKHENHSFSFPDEETSLPFHPPSVILSVFFCPASILFSLYGRVSVPGPCGGRSLDPFFMIFFFNLFYIYFYMYGWRRDGSRFIWQVSSTHPTLFCLVSLFPFQAYFSQYLPVLSKCYCKVFQWDDSKYVYINRGNTLGYILLNPCVAWSLRRLASWCTLNLHKVFAL